MNLDSRIYVAGHRGLVGSALVRRLKDEGFKNIITFGHEEVDLRDEIQVSGMFRATLPHYVFLAAARVGGVCSNQRHEADFLLDNLRIQNNVISNADKVGVKKLLFLGSACIYPRLAREPVKESALLTGPLEPSNEWYALAKIAGLKLCQAYRRQNGRDFISCQPCNLYGLGDHYDPVSSHVLPALIRKFHEAKTAGSATVTCWGSGRPRREFLYSDDMADACITLMRGYSDESPANIGTGADMTIGTLAGLIAEVVGFKGTILWDTSKPDGTPRRRLDTSKMDALGWEPKMELREGLQLTYADFCEGFGG